MEWNGIESSDGIKSDRIAGGARRDRGVTSPCKVLCFHNRDVPATSPNAARPSRTPEPRRPPARPAYRGCRSTTLAPPVATFSTTAFLFTKCTH
jgi:hypothetical protein